MVLCVWRLKQEDTFLKGCLSLCFIINTNAKRKSRMNSNYKVHPTFTGYAVSKDGAVINRRTNRKLKPQPDGKGYLYVSLRKDNKGHCNYCHRLVLETYNPIENQHLYHAHHKNHIRNDNRLENLEWVLIADHIREHQKGKVFSEETRRKLSEANKGKVLSEETKRKIGEAQKGKVFSEETKRKISEGCKGTNKGKVLSEETRKRMSEGKKGTLFWNDGTRNIRSKECPGEGWVRGRKKGYCKREVKLASTL